jgi:hypothetical protein
VGDKGAQGSIGVQGKIGSQGVIGSQGIQGTFGSQGLAGQDGASGPPGDFQGTQGAAGYVGTDGVPGEAGNQGTQGTQGTFGTQGFFGIQGSVGLQGENGTQGIDGETGLQGSSGTQGRQGVQGPPGQGAQGTQGPLSNNQGTQGTAGDPGYWIAEFYNANSWGLGSTLSFSGGGSGYISRINQNTYRWNLSAGGNPILASREYFENFTATITFGDYNYSNTNSAFGIGIIGSNNATFGISFGRLDTFSKGESNQYVIKFSSGVLKIYRNSTLISDQNVPFTSVRLLLGFTQVSNDYGRVFDATVSITPQGTAGESGDSFPYLTDFGKIESSQYVSYKRVSFDKVYYGGSWFKKTGGSDQTYDAKVFSLLGHADGCYVSHDFINGGNAASYLSPNGYNAVTDFPGVAYGLRNGQPFSPYYSAAGYTTGSSLGYDSISYCFKWDYNGGWYPAIYESGVLVYSAGGSSSSPSLGGGFWSTSIYYDGYNIKYYINNTMVRSVARAQSFPLHFEASLYRTGTSVGPFRFGYAGPKGLQGSPGNFQGTQGIQGIQGTQGTQGTQGLDGKFAGQGVQGSISNFQGIQGLQGLQGLQGVQGVQGLDGLFAGQGTQGTQGLSNQGTKGTQGTQGTQGLNGLFAGQGTQGSAGEPGYWTARFFTTTMSNYLNEIISSFTETYGDLGSYQNGYYVNATKVGVNKFRFPSNGNINNPKAFITTTESWSAFRATLVMPPFSQYRSIAFGVIGSDWRSWTFEIDNYTTSVFAGDTIIIDYDSSGIVSFTNVTRSSIGLFLTINTGSAIERRFIIGMPRTVDFGGSSPYYDFTLSIYPRGLQGLQGALSNNQGTQGLWGPQGTQGTQGRQGVQGIQGIQGLDGLFAGQGAQGLQGLQGSRGTQGVQGVQGLDGLFAGQGTQGLMGAGLSEALSIAYSIALS